MQNITKAVIPCGGLGTRFLPITKAVPKEILPVIDTPVLGYIVSEAIESGITDIMIVLGHGKEAIKNYFTPNPELEENLSKNGKTEFLEILKKIKNGANIVFTVQEKPRGSADAVMLAESFTGREVFALAWGDDLIYSKNPVMNQLKGAYKILEGSILGVQYYDGDDIVKYGVAKISENEKNTKSMIDNAYLCQGIMEKPKLSEIPSRLASLGRYILTPNVYDAIRRIKPGLNGELQLTDALNAMCKEDRIYAYEFEGRRYDMGDKLGSVQAVIEYALRNPEFSDQIKAYIKEIALKL